MGFLRRHKFLSFLGAAVILIIIIVGAANGGSKPTADAHGSPATSASTDVTGQTPASPVATPASAAPPSTAAPASTAALTSSAPATAAPATTAAPASSAPAPAAPASTPAAPSGSSMTTAQQQAVDAAQNYLALGQGFSYAGLLQQLTSSSGSGFASCSTPLLASTCTIVPASESFSSTSSSGT
jgi:Host cell surface-exposed lipoprotein